MTSNLERTRLAYRREERDRETKRAVPRPALSHIAAKLPSDYQGLLMRPPAKHEEKFLTSDIIDLLQDLDFANKGIQAVPRLEQRITALKHEIYDVMEQRGISEGDRLDKLNGLRASLQNEEQSLARIQAEIDSSIKSAGAYARNAPDEISRATSTLQSLRKEVSLPYKLADAKDDLPAVKKAVADLLQDLHDEGSLERRLEIQKALDSAGVDHRALVKQAEREAMRPFDRLVAEQLDSQAEAGKPSSQRPNSEGESPSE